MKDKWWIVLLVFGVLTAVISDPIARETAAKEKRTRAAQDFELVFGISPINLNYLRNRQAVDLLVDRYFELLLPEACEQTKQHLGMFSEGVQWEWLVVDSQLKKAESLAREFGYQPPTQYDKYKARWLSITPEEFLKRDQKDFVCY